MENPETWDDITKLIDQTIQEWEDGQREGICGLSLAQTIRNVLEAHHLLLIA
jgi:hypothetical protein